MNGNGIKFSTIPSSIVKIGSNAFANCALPNEITFEGTPEILESGIFLECDNISAIYVPWEKGDIANAPWGAKNAIVYYNGVPDFGGRPNENTLIFNMPLNSTSKLHETISDTDMTNNGNGSVVYAMTGGGDHKYACIPYSKDATVSFQIAYNGFNTTDPTAANYVDVSGSFTLAGWIEVTNAANSTWYTFMSLGDYSGDKNSVKPANNGGKLKVLNLMTKYGGKLGGGSEDTNIGIDYNAPSGSFTKTNTYSTYHWYLMVLTYDAINRILTLYMNRTVNNVESMQMIGSIPNMILSIDPSTDLTLYLGFLKNKRQFNKR